MPRELKIVLFTCVSLIGVGSFVAKTIETGSALTGIVFTLQLFGIIVALIVLVLFFMWIGSKIWKE